MKHSEVFLIYGWIRIALKDSEDSGYFKRLRKILWGDIKIKQKYGEAGIGIKKIFWYQKPVFMAFEAFKTMK